MTSRPSHGGLRLLPIEDEAPDPGLLTPTIDWWVQDLAHPAHPRSPATIRLYGGALRNLNAYLAAAGHSTRLSEITTSDLDAYLRRLGEQPTAKTAHGLSPKSLLAIHGYLSIFFNWAINKELLTTNPMRRIEASRVPDSMPNITSDEDFAALLQAVRGRDFIARRDTFILHWFNSTGSRRAEVANLRLSDINLDQHTATFRGKGNKERTVWFDADTYEALQHYLRLRRTHRMANRSDRLLLGHTGEMSPNAIGDLIERAARKAGLTGIHPHALRHRWADRLKSQGLSEESLKALGGWSDSRYLEIYGRANRRARAIDEIRRLHGEAGQGR